MEENKFVQSLAPKDDFWIGYTDQQVEGRWVWTEKGSTNTFTNWDHGQPDDHHNQDCAMIWGWYHIPQWDDRQCGDSKRYVCERGKLIKSMLMLR